jgi:alpha-glucosidase
MTETVSPALAGSQPGQTGPAPWWRDAVIYQVYLRSFADSDGDGVGDLAGLRERLDHLTRLGVDGLWLNPCYPSPGADHGYDVADYVDIDPRYGGLAEFDALLVAAHRRGLRVLMDLVPNHCSATHPWFVAALAAPPGSPQRERFVFRRGGGALGELPPNNWRSVFGGPAWTRVGESDQWYLHSFDPAQPDFNWRDPVVRDYFEDVLRFWFDRGVDGFRIDVAHMLVKHADLPDWSFPADGSASYNEHTQNQPEVHDILRGWRRVADSYGREATLVGEIWVPTIADLARYLRADELPQAFHFDLLQCGWDASAFRASVDRGLTSTATTGATVTWTLANHDMHRAVTRFGLVRAGGSTDGSPDVFSDVLRGRGEVDLALGERRARAALLLLLGLPGSVYLYQGEELGLPEVLDLPDEARQDPIWFRSGGLEHGRDGCRVPLPWREDGATFGFSAPVPAGPPVPWLPQPAWFARYAVDRQWNEAASVLWLHADALRLRRDLLPVLGDDLVWLDAAGRPDVLAYRRGPLTVVTVFGEEPFDAPAAWGGLRLCSAATDGTPPGSVHRLAPHSTGWFLRA